MSSASVVHIVASCSDRKRIGLGAAVQLRTFKVRDPVERLERWWSALSDDDGHRLAARDLYVGPYWAAVRDLGATGARAGLQVHLWVASAGYGLVPESASLRCYSATFRSNVADSVIRSQDAMRGFHSKWWWDALSRKRASGWKGPRRVSAIAQRDPSARIIIIGSPGYVSALEDDLLDVLSTHNSAERLLIVSGEKERCRNELHASWITSSARLLSVVGGSLPALHARVARKILDDAPRFGLDATALRARWARISERSPEAMKPVRTQATDDEVKAFIRSSLREQPKSKHTKLLRDFRAAGRACEQSRFRNLFMQVTGDQRQ